MFSAAFAVLSIDLLTALLCSPWSDPGEIRASGTAICALEEAHQMAARGACRFGVIPGPDRMQAFPQRGRSGIG